MFVSALLCYFAFVVVVVVVVVVAVQALVGNFGLSSRCRPRNFDYEAWGPVFSSF